MLDTNDFPLIKSVPQIHLGIQFRSKLNESAVQCTRYNDLQNWWPKQVFQSWLANFSGILTKKPWYDFLQPSEQERGVVMNWPRLFPIYLYIRAFKWDSICFWVKIHFQDSSCCKRWMSFVSLFLRTLPIYLPHFFIFQNLIFQIIPSNPHCLCRYLDGIKTRHF